MFKRLKNDKYASIALYAFYVVLASVVLIFTFINFGGIWSYAKSLIKAVTAFIYGFLIAYICNPIYKRLYLYVFVFLDKKKPHPKLRKTLSLISTYIILFGVIAIIIFSLIPSISDNINMLINNINIYIDNMTTSIINFVKDLSVRFPMINPDEILDSFNNLLYDENGKLIIMNYLGPTADFVLTIGTNVVQHVAYIVIGIILSIYFLMYKNTILAKTRKLMCAIFPKKTYCTIMDFTSYTDKTFGRYLMGAVLDSMLVGVIVVIVLSILGIKFSVLIGVMIGITNIIPFFGPFLGAVPSALIILIADGPLDMLFFIIAIVVIQQLDGNILNPHIVGATTGLTPIGVIAAVTICSHVLGFVGMVIGVPLCAVLTYIVSQTVNKRLKKKNLAYDTKSYMSRDIFHDEAFIKASIEVEAQNEMERKEENERILAEEQEHDRSLEEIQDHLIYVKEHPELFAIKQDEELLNGSDDDDNDDFLEDF